MKTKEEVEILNEKHTELTHHMLDVVNGGETDFPLCPPQSGRSNIVLNTQNKPTTRT